MPAVDVARFQQLHQQQHWSALLDQLQLLPLPELRNFRLWWFQAAAWCGLGRPELSLTAFAEALHLAPGSVALRLEAIAALQRCGDWAVSLRLLQHPDSAELMRLVPAKIMLARAQANLGQHADALQRLDQLQQESDLDLVALGVALIEIHLAFGDLNQAWFCWQRLEALSSNDLDVLLIHVRLLASDWHADHGRRMLKLVDDHPQECWLALQVSRVLRQKLMVDEARGVLSAAIKRHGFFGDLAEAWLALLVVEGEVDALKAWLAREPMVRRRLQPQRLMAECLLRDLRPAEARDLLLPLDSDDEALSLLSDAYRRLGDYTNGLDVIEKLLLRRPGSADLQLQMAYQLLAQGRWSEAWPLYENRFGIAGVSSFLAPGMGPRNHWISPHQRSVLVFAEQGFGDTLMMASMLPDLAQVAERLVVMVQPRLLPLLACSFPQLEIVSGVSQERFAAVDSCYGIGSLGRFFRHSPDECPAHSYLNVPEESCLHWRHRLASLPETFSVGLAWRGGGDLGEHRRRSLGLEALMPLLSLTGVNWINLQYRHSQVQLDQLQHDRGVQVHHFDGITEDLLETAALTKELDLVITVQQTALHIAGGVGTTAWVLVPVAPEWRYGIEGSRMPWYSSVELFRQTRLSDWSDPIERVRTRLMTALAQRAGQNGPIS